MDELLRSGQPGQTPGTNALTEYVFALKDPATKAALIAEMAQQGQAPSNMRSAWDNLINFNLTPEQYARYKTDTRFDDVNIPMANLPDTFVLHQPGGQPGPTGQPSTPPTPFTPSDLSLPVFNQPPLTGLPGFYDSPEYHALTPGNQPKGPLMGQPATYISRYFGEIDVDQGPARDQAFEAYMRRTGQSLSPEGHALQDPYGGMTPGQALGGGLTRPGPQVQPPQFTAQASPDPLASQMSQYLGIAQNFNK